MKARVREIIEEALDGLIKDGVFKGMEERPGIIVERPKQKEFGDASTNIAMLLAKPLRKKPRDIAEKIARKAGAAGDVERCEVAGPGFINVFLNKTYWPSRLKEILADGSGVGKLDVGAGKKVQVEFVSANPTGPLHIGHGRGAAVGDSMANILKAAGFDVTKEFYINDVGRQVEVLGRSVYLRYLELLGRVVVMPEESYRGGYIKDVAGEFLDAKGDAFKETPEEEAIPVFRDFAKERLLERIRRDLLDFGIEFDVWYSEKSLHEKGLVTKALEELKEKDLSYEEEGALWFRSSGFGDDKDRVLIKADGAMTYFASDIAYHRDKLERGFDTLINVWGADHHGYESRVRAFIKAMGRDDSALHIIFIQLVSLLRDGAPVAMGKRQGEFVTLRQVMDEVGSDAARFFFLTRRADAHLDFDLELAKKQAPENPVYYVQYCYARIKSIFEFAAEKGAGIPEEADEKDLARLDGEDAVELIKHLASFDEVIERSALDYEPHRVTFYLMELAGLFHPYYNRNRVVTEDAGLTRARLFLCRAVANVTGAGLKLLGISAPEKM